MMSVISKTLYLIGSLCFVAGTICSMLIAEDPTT